MFPERNMAIHSVRLTADAYMVCLAHALSTEKEEIMGLLIGEIDENRVSHISAVIMLRRSDKQPDRVEISPEQLSSAATRAEELAQQLGRPMRVLGWYHSHPRITVWPSHVDVQTQAMYQMLDEGFVGIIFSVFVQDKHTRHNKLQVTCFQSINQSPEGQPPQLMRLEIPLHIVPTPTVSRSSLEALVELPRILSQEEEEAYLSTTKVPDMDLITQIHNGSVFSSSLCQIMEIMTSPMMQTLENRLHRNKHKMEELKKEKERLMKDLKQMSPSSPHKTTSV